MIQTTCWGSLAIIWSQYILFIKEKGWKTTWIGNLPAHVGILVYMNLSIKSNQRKTPVLFYLCVCVSLLGRVEALLSLPTPYHGTVPTLWSHSTTQYNQK